MDRDIEAGMLLEGDSLFGGPVSAPKQEMRSLIITLCGSARFEPWFHAWTEALGLAGHAVFGLCAWPSRHGGEKNWYTPEQKKMLDLVHFNKISASHAIVVLNVFAYLGESTLNEIAFARKQGKDIYFLQGWGKGCGIGPSHTEAYRAAADYYGVYGFGSPICTSDDRDVWSTALLGPAGANRSAIVDFLHREELKATSAPPSISPPPPPPPSP